MHIVPMNINSKVSIREKAKLNICIAKDLTDSFGGRKADYIIRLNQKLKMKVALPVDHLKNHYVEEIFKVSGGRPIFPIADAVESYIKACHEL